MPLKSSSPRKILVAVIAALLCAGVWYKRLSDNGAFVSQSAPTTIAKAKEPASSSPFAAVGSAAPVLATINWADPENPTAIPISSRGTRFLFDTSSGLQVWDSGTLKMNPLQQPVANARLLENIWMRTSGGNNNGTLFAVISRFPATTSVLFWLRDDQSKIDSRLELPESFSPSELVRLSSNMALVCDAVSKRSIVLGIPGGKLIKLTQMTAAPDAMQVMQKIGVIGQVEGFGDVVRPRYINGYPADLQPLLFDTRNCTWSAKNLPEPLASGVNLQILPKAISYGLGGARWSIVAASWLDPISKKPRTLEVPFLWDHDDQLWRERQASDFPGMAPNRLSGVAGEDWTYAAEIPQGKFAFLASNEERWREATQTIPATENLKLLPIGHEGVLALLVDSKQPGRVVRLDPTKEKWLSTPLRNRINGSEGAIPLNNGGLMLLAGSEASRVSVISPDLAEVELLPGLPQPQTRVSGVQLSDGSVVVFGGLHPSCYASDLRSCKQGAQPGFRWIPTEKKWQPLMALAVPFAYGEIFDGGNSGITSSYNRNDFLLHGGRELYYLSRSTIRAADEQSAEPTRLYRWRLDGATQVFAPTRLSRYNSSLIELDDGRLAVIGGSSADEPPSPACQICENKRKQEVTRLLEELSVKAEIPGDSDMEEHLDPEQMVPRCDSCNYLPAGERFAFARSCELYDPHNNRWHFGPFSNYPGGRVVKLDNGRLFKFGLLGYNASDAIYAAEMADAALAEWTAAPPFPFSNPAEVTKIQVMGNQVLVVMANQQDRYVIWDDASRNWQVHPLPRHSDWGLRTTPLHVSPGGKGKVLMIHEYSYEYLTWPLQ